LLRVKEIKIVTVGEDAVSKKNITYIKHIRPQIKAKEAIDKADSRHAQYRKALEHTGLDPGITLDDMAQAFSIFKRIRGEKK